MHPALNRNICRLLLDMNEMCCLCSSALYTAKQVVINLSSTCGPAISIVLFLCLGNSWEVRPRRSGGASNGTTSCCCSYVGVSAWTAASRSPLQSLCCSNSVSTSILLDQQD